LRQCDGLPRTGEFRLPFGPLIPLASCAIIVFLLAQFPADEATSVALLVAAAVAIYTVRSVVRGRTAAGRDTA
jgi:hypothetical protein